jgi:hypothetical protein
VGKGAFRQPCGNNSVVHSSNSGLLSDGVVPYWSSHLDGAKSECIVPGPHGSCQLPQTITELDRILRLHLGTCSQLFIGTHDEASSVAALCGHNPYWSAYGICGSHTAGIPIRHADVFDDNLPILHAPFHRQRQNESKPAQMTRAATFLHCRVSLWYGGGTIVASDVSFTP